MCYARAYNIVGLRLRGPVILYFIKKSCRNNDKIEILGNGR